MLNPSMRRLACLALVLTACFSDAPPVEEGADEGTGSGSADDDSTGETTASASTTTVADSSEAEAASGAASNGTETGTPACGDGVIDTDEDCDDQNGDETDGCRSDCHFGPRAITMTLTDAPTGIVPGGAFAFTGSCTLDMPRAIDRYHGKFGGVAPYWPISITGTCSHLALVFEPMPHIVPMPDGEMLEQYGDFNGDQDWSLVCERGTVPIGVHGQWYDGSPPNVRGLRFACARLIVDPDAPDGVAFMPVDPSAWAPGDHVDDATAESMCEPGAILVGLRGDVDLDLASVQQLGAECASVRVEFGPV